MDWKRRRRSMRQNMDYRSQSQQSCPYNTYDPYQYEGMFERGKPLQDDKTLLDALLKRVSELTPPASHQAALLSLITKVQQVVDNLIINPGNFMAAQIDEVRQVGPHKLGTLLGGDNHAHIVIILKTLPTFEAVSCLSIKMHQELQKTNPQDTFTVVVNKAGFDVSCGPVHTTRVLISTILPNLVHLQPSLHLDAWTMEKHLICILHCRWLEDNINHLNVKVLIRLLKDLRRRFEGLQALTPWMINLFAHHCVMHSSHGHPLPINIAFRRALSSLATGFFTAGSGGLIDPCDPGHHCVHALLTAQQQDLVCMTAQSLLRVLLHGGHEYVLALKPPLDIVNKTNVIEGVLVSASERVLEGSVPQMLEHEVVDE